MTTKQGVTILVYALCFTMSVLAQIPPGTKPGTRELVTMEMFQKSGKTNLLILDADFTILVRYPPQYDKKARKSLCSAPGFPLRFDERGTILECGIMRPGFTQFIMEAKEVFYLIIYTANDLNDARVIATVLEDMYPGTHFEVRANPHIHLYPLLKNGGRLEGGGSKDLLNIIEEALIPLALILEDAPYWYYRLPRAPNQLLCLIQVPKAVVVWNKEQRIFDVDYNDTTLTDIRVFLSPILNPTNVITQKTLRQMLDTERALQNRTGSNEPWIRSEDLTCRAKIEAI